MENSDIMLGWVDDNDGSVVLQDRYTDDSMSTPSIDDEDHLTLIEGEQEDGITRIRFQRTRTLDCDDESGHDMAVSQGTSRVIYAYHDDDGDEDDADSIAYHTSSQRGSQSVNLWYGESSTVELEDDVEYFDLRMSNWSVSSEDTEYVCKLIELPTFNDTQHVVMIEPLIESGNEGTVHHIVFYVCPETWIYDDVDDTHQSDCDEWEENMPSEDCGGARMEYAWAIGGGKHYYPEVAGLPMSGDSSFHFVYMQIHYDNPELRSDIVDSSGLRMWYTPTLREYDAGMMIIGSTVDSQRMFAPPGVVTTVTGYCHSDCTQGIPQDGVTAFGNLLHAHTVGSALSLRHIRDGVELEPLDVNDHYDFDYQQTTYFDEFVTLLPGDQFIMHCTYDTTEKENMVLSGEATSEEMCISFLYVYPVPDSYDCRSGFSDDAVSLWLNDAYDAGYWDINISVNDSWYDMEDLIEEGFLESAGSIDMNYWNEYGIYWNHEMEGAADFYEMFWNNSNSKYSGRLSTCYSYISGDYSESLTNYVDEFGEFEEYCTDSCGCEEEEEEEEKESNIVVSTVAIAIFVVMGVIVVCMAFIFVWMCRRKEKVYGSAKPYHVAQTSTPSAENDGIHETTVYGMN